MLIIKLANYLKLEAPNHNDLSKMKGYFSHRQSKIISRLADVWLSSFSFERKRERERAGAEGQREKHNLFFF